MTAPKTLKIRKIGNFAVLAFPFRLLLDLKLKIGSSLVVSQTPEGVLLKPVRRSYSFEQLMSQCDAGASASGDIKTLDAKLAAFDPKLHGGEVMAMRPVGREVL